jgi:hypothetical protein
MIVAWGILGVGSALAYYYPPSNVPLGPPPNYNQVDTVYFLGTPELPLPPPDSGGIYIYYDQGMWNVANHIYSKGNSFEQFHCCILVELDEPPTPGVNVFAQDFELEVPWDVGDTAKCHCLRQNDRWGWTPWGENLYEIWWDVSTRDWDSKCGGDPNDFMRFSIAGCAIDFNLWSSGHGMPFGPDQIFLGANKTPLSSISGFVDTYPGISDPYQSQAGSNPEDDPNVTIFTQKSDILRSYNKRGLIHPSDSYFCLLAWHYGERYAGTFAYEGNGVQFSTASLCPQNEAPSIMITPDTSVFLCEGDSVRIWILASDPDGDVITIEKTYGTGTYSPKTGISPIADDFYFHPDTSGVYVFIFRVTDEDELTDEDTSHITVALNQPPVLICPDDGSVNAGDKFISGNFPVSDPKCWPKVRICGIDPSATNQPVIVSNHVEWQTVFEDACKVFTICLEVEDECGAKDTCYFEVTVLDRPPEITCPEDDSVHGGEYFVSSSFSVFDPEGGQVTVTLLSVTPEPHWMPTIVGNLVKWQTDCHDEGIYTICLEAEDDCGGKDTCCFEVTMYNQPPELTCPDDDSVHAGELFVSTDYSVYDPEGDPVAVYLLSISPRPTNNPIIVDQHIEWQTTCEEDGDYVIRLLASECCQPADTCEFTVTVYNRPPEITCPENAMVYAGDTLVSTDFSVTDPDGETALVTFLYIDPPASNDPAILGNHVEWITTANEADREFDIFLVATDPCGLADTCNFTVTVVSIPVSILDCPEDDSVHATVPAVNFVSTNFSVTGPGADPSGVRVIGIEPSPAVDMPYRVESHIEWLTDCDDAGKTFTICLEATFDVGPKDTCCFSVTVYNRAPELSCPEDDSVHAEDTFISTSFSVNDPDGDDAPVVLLDINPSATNDPIIVEDYLEWVTTCAEDGEYVIRLVATDPCGLADTCEFMVTVYNQPPQLTCPEDETVDAGDTFISSDFFASDPDGDPTVVSFLDIAPSATNDPFVVDSHLEWITTSSEEGDYIIRLVATDPCGLADTCQFTVRVDEPTGVFECPEDDSVHAGDYFISTDFVLTHPDCDPSSVEVLEVNPPVRNMPFVSNYHVEWQTTCDEDGDYFITLITGEQCSIPDTCSFMVTVYNRPPELICPDYGTVGPMALFISTDFFFSDPDGDQVTVSLLGIDPPAEYDPVIVEHHVEWQTACVFGDYIIGLVAVDECGAADTCEFMVTVTYDPVPDFYIWIYPITDTTTQGGCADYLVELNSMNGYHKSCSLQVYGLPAPPSNGIFDDPVMIPTDFTNMNVCTLPQTDTGTYTLIVTGKEIGGFIAHSTLVYLTVLDPSEPLDIDDDADDADLPPGFALFQNQPNPFNPQTQLSYYLPEASQVKVDIYNVLGQKVRDLFEGHQNAGTHILIWNGRDNSGKQLSSGVYLYRLEADGFQQIKKMTLMK